MYMITEIGRWRQRPERSSDLPGLVTLSFACYGESMNITSDWKRGEAGQPNGTGYGSGMPAGLSPHLRP